MEPILTIAVIVGTILVLVSFAAKPIPAKIKSEFIRDVEEHEFEAAVVGTSRHTPVILDFLGLVVRTLPKY